MTSPFFYPTYKALIGRLFLQPDKTAISTTLILITERIRYVDGDSEVRKPGAIDAESLEFTAVEVKYVGGEEGTQLRDGNCNIAALYFSPVTPARRPVAPDCAATAGATEINHNYA